jgi:hypothetical protein
LAAEALGDLAQMGRARPLRKVGKESDLPPGSVNRITIGAMSARVNKRFPPRPR